MRLVEVSGGSRVFEQTYTGDRPPHETLLGGLDASHVRGHDVGVQQWVSGPAGSMVERGGDDAVAREQASVASTGTGEHGSVFVVADDLVDGLGVGLSDLSAALVVGERPQDAHALRWTQGQVIARSEARLSPARHEPVQLVARYGPSVATRQTRHLSCRVPRRYAEGSGTTSSVDASSRRSR